MSEYIPISNDTFTIRVGTSPNEVTEFEIDSKLLSKYPESALSGSLRNQSSLLGTEPFPRSSTLFDLCILPFLKNGQIPIPKGFTPQQVAQEFDFYNLPFSHQAVTFNRLSDQLQYRFTHYVMNLYRNQVEPLFHEAFNDYDNFLHINKIPSINTTARSKLLQLLQSPYFGFDVIDGTITIPVSPSPYSQAFQLMNVWTDKCMNVLKKFVNTSGHPDVTQLRLCDFLGPWTIPIEEWRWTLSPLHKLFQKHGFHCTLRSSDNTPSSPKRDEHAAVLRIRNNQQFVDDKYLAMRSLEISVPKDADTTLFSGQLANMFITSIQNKAKSISDELSVMCEFPEFGVEYQFKDGGVAAMVACDLETLGVKCTVRQDALVVLMEIDPEMDQQATGSPRPMSPTRTPSNYDY